MAAVGFTEEHRLDDNGNPAGGETVGTGFYIEWQNGPLVNPETGERLEPSGAFVEDVIAACAGRIRFYQQGRFACEENERALELLGQAGEWLAKRTRDREARGVEGTHEL